MAKDIGDRSEGKENVGMSLVIEQKRVDKKISCSCVCVCGAIAWIKKRKTKKRIWRHSSHRFLPCLTFEVTCAFHNGKMYMSVALEEKG